MARRGLGRYYVVVTLEGVEKLRANIKRRKLWRRGGITVMSSPSRQVHLLGDDAPNGVRESNT